MATKQKELDSTSGTELARFDGMTVVDVILGGETPMLQHRVPPETLIAIWGKHKAPKNAANPEPREQARLHLYRDEVSDPEAKVAVLPQDNLFACLRAAGRFIRLQGKSMVSTRKDTQLPGLMGIIAPPYLKLYHRTSGKPATWETDMRPARNATGDLVCAIRPRFDSWSMRFKLWIDQTELPIDKARQLIDIAGSRIGVGSFRPEKKGTFGRFVVDQWKVIQGP